jgi:hypothetical protein
MVFPLMYEFNIDWYETAQTGAIARTTEHYLGFNIFGQEYYGYWHDIHMAGYNWGVACLLTAVMACVIQLVVLNQIDEEQSITYTKALGPMAKKFSFKSLIIGLILPLAGPMSLRINATMQTFAGFLHYIVSGIIVTYVLFTIYRSVKALYVCIDEQEAYDPIVLSQEECMQKARAYFAKHPDDYHASDFCNCLTFISPLSYKVPLTYSAKLRAMKAFYKVLSEHESLELDGPTLAKISLHKADTLPVDHAGQEYELGDELDQVAASIMQSVHKAGEKIEKGAKGLKKRETTNLDTTNNDGRTVI